MENSDSQTKTVLPSSVQPTAVLPQKRKVKLPFLLLGLILIILLIWGGIKLFRGGKLPLSSQEVTLTYWGLWEPEPVISGVIAQFEKDHPRIKVDYQMHSPRDFKARLQNALASEKGPDIFRLHQSWLPMFANLMVPVPVEVKEVLALETAYFPAVSQAIRFKGNFLALPLMVDSLALYYNKELVDKTGGRLPLTWWGLQKMAVQLTQKDAEGKIIVAGAALGTTNNVDHWSDIIGLMLFQNGANPGAPGDQLTEDVLRYYSLFATKDQVWDATLPASTLMFSSGKLAFYFAPSWRYFEIRNANPNLRFGITTVPQLPQSREIDWEEAEKGNAELTNINWSSFWVEGVSAKSAHQKEAWEFLAYLASEEGLQNLFQAASQVRDFGEIYPRVQLATQLEQNPYLKPFITQAKNARSWYLCSFTHDDSLNDSLINYYGDAVNSILAGNSPSLAVATLSDGVRQVLQRHGIAE